MGSLVLSNDVLNNINNYTNKLDIKEFLIEIEYNIDNLYIDKFWESITDDKWIYINNEMLIYIGYSNIDINNGKRKYLNLITNEFEEIIDYKLLNKSEFSKCPIGHLENIEINTHNKTKHLIVSPDCFKQSLMMMRTEKAKQIKKYYIELEKIFKFYLQYQNIYTNKQLEIEKSKNTKLTNNVINYSTLKKLEYFYIATSSYYAGQNNFKLGKTSNLNSRLSNFNNTHNVKEKFYFCFIFQTYNAKVIEDIAKGILHNFRNSETNELYVLHYDILEMIVKNICENYNNSVDYYNNFIQIKAKDIVSKIPKIPNMMKIPDVIQNTKNLFIDNNDISTDIEDHEISDIEVSDIKEDIIEETNDNVDYYNDNKDYPFLRFRESDKNLNFKCLRCDYIFNRIDHLKVHFDRKNKCFDNLKLEKINLIKNNNNKPIMKYFRENKDYEYFEKYNDEEDRIYYYCNRCDYNTNILNSLKTHFDRKNKCYNEIKISMEKKIFLITDNPLFKYYKYKDNNISQYECFYCKYITTANSNMNRHFKRVNPCFK